MTIEHGEDAVVLASNLNAELGDTRILHILAPALHLAACILDLVAAI